MASSKCQWALFLLHTVFLFPRTSQGTTVSIELNITKEAAEVETTFLSIALDSFMIAKDLRPVPFDSQRFITLCSGLSSVNINRPMVILRIGGTKGDDVIFKEKGLDINSENYVLNSTEWDLINSFAMKMQWKLIFGLNALERKHDGSWDPTNFIQFMRYSSTKGYVVNYELGNEPDLWLGHRNISIPPEQLARDYALLKVLLTEEAHNSPVIFGPDVATLNRDNYFEKFLANLDVGILEAITYHFYYGASANSTAVNFTDPSYLDKFMHYAISAKEIIDNSPVKDTPIWIGETANTYGGGAFGLSDRYAAGFLWLDKLGLAARLNIKVVIRQTLLGGNYSLIDSDLHPSPDYWISVLYKQLVGHRVLDVAGSLQPLRKARIYAHCINDFGSHKYEPGSIVLIALNLDLHNELAFNLTGSLAKLSADEFIFEPVDHITSRDVKLNGKILKLIDDKTLPNFTPKPVSPPFKLPSLTYGLFVVKNARLKVCL